jgi:phospho-N-acetylmuramoyl-pentapeptide-transferase
MERVLAAGLLSMLISIVAGPKFIEFLRRNEMGQHIREEGPAGHQVKQGTPTMGGLLMVFSASVAFLSLSHYTTEGITVFLVMLGCGAIGFADDYTKLRHRRSLGLPGRWKLLLLAGITIGLAFAVDDVNAPSDVYVPVLD